MDDRRTQRIARLTYLGLCHARGWPPSDEGLKAFLRQRKMGWRDWTGRMIWPK